MAKTYAFFALCFLSYVALCYGRSEPIIEPPNVCPKGVNQGDSYPGPGCSICQCHYTYISCKGCGTSLAPGYVEFRDEGGVYPKCCTQFVDPEKILLRKKARRRRRCRKSEQLMCVTIRD